MTTKSRTSRPRRKNVSSRTKVQINTELDDQLSEVTRLLVRILKAMRFTDSQITSAIRTACNTEKPRLVRFPTAGKGELWGNVLCRWMENPKFVDEFGRPRVIPISGSTISFAALVKQAIPGADAKECLDGLLKMRSVVRIGPKQVRLRSPATIYSAAGATFVEGILLSVRELLRTVSWNLIEQSRSGEAPLFQRGVTGVEITEDDMHALSHMVNIHGMNLLESVNAWANQKTMRAKQLKQKLPTVRPYVGIYVSRGRS